MSSGNKLQKVEDAVSGNAYANDFRDVTGNDYTYSTDGKLTKDGNKSISKIDYNFLDLISKVKFSSGDSIVYYYTSTGTRRQKVVTKSGVKIYTLYDGEMVYTFTGVNTSINDFKVAEIQNAEGRFVNGKLEYGYTDHVGNLRLSYKDSLGVAFITQSQSYDTWSNVLAGTEYSLNSSIKDPYLVCGKEFQNETGFTSLDWRGYDSVLGRMHTYDPEDQSQMLSGYAYCGNNPVMQVDPDGRFWHIIIGAAIGGLVNGYIHRNQEGGFLKGFAIGAVAGAVGAATGGAAFAAAGGAGAGAGGFFAGAISGVAGSAVSSPILGFGNQASFNDPYSAGDFGRDLLIGGITGGVINGGIAGFKGKNFWSGNPRSMGSNGVFSLKNTKALAEEGWSKLGNGKWGRTIPEVMIQNHETRFLTQTKIESYGKTIQEGTFDLKPHLDRIDAGDVGKHIYKNDGAIFKNVPKNGSEVLPANGMYREYYVPINGMKVSSARMIKDLITGNMWFTGNHYQTFIPVRYTTVIPFK